jgi:hypothetical protein
MGFLIQCDNKKCREFQEPVLDKDTDDVHCSQCDGVIDHVSIFAKRQMRANGQIKRESVPKQAFAVKCVSCEKIMCPQLIEEKSDGQATSKLVCPSCGEEHTHLGAPYKQTVVAFLKKAL